MLKVICLCLICSWQKRDDAVRTQCRDSTDLKNRTVKASAATSWYFSWLELYLHLNILFVHLSSNHICSPQSLCLPCTSAFLFFASVILYSQLSDPPPLKEGSPWSPSNLSLQQVTLD